MEKNRNPPSYALFCLQVFKPYRWLIACVVFLSSIWAVDLSLRPYLIKMMVNNVSSMTGSIKLEILWWLVFFYICMSFIVEITHRLNDWIWRKLQPNLRKSITLLLVERMMEHSHHYYQGVFAGSLTTKINDVAANIPQLLGIFLETFISRAMALLIAIYTMWIVNDRFSVSLIIWVTLFLIIAFKSSKESKFFADNRAHIRSLVSGRMVDIFSNMLSVKIFVGKDLEMNGLGKTLQEFVSAIQERDWFFIKVRTYQGLSFIIFQVICFWWLMKGLENHTISPGDFALILALNISILDVLWRISDEMRVFSELLGEVNQGMKTIFAPIEITDRAGAKALIIKKGQITFQEVGFHYNNATPLFTDLSITILPAQKVGLVGYSGSGKTTFANLILRLFDVTSGSILIDNQNNQDVTQDSLRHNISMIPQDIPLFHRTLLENIRYGRTNATDEEVIQAAKRAHAHEFISALPLGYDSLVGERGIKLSGGQRQRIAIARAALKNAPLLILDEATSQLDSVTESSIQESLWQLMQGKTTLVIAHRLSTLLHMDRIVVFDKGRIVEDGTHQELLAKGGLYQTLWDAQVGGFLPDREKA